MKRHRIRVFVFLLAAMVCIAFVPLTDSYAAAAKKAAKGTNKISITPKTALLNVDNSKKITIKLNKKQKKALKIKITSSKKSIVKAPASVTVKKNKNKASFNVKGVSPGSSNIKVTLVMSNGSKKTATAKITVKEKEPEGVALTNVTLNNKAPEIGDTLTAAIDPEDADGVTYAWYSGDAADSITTVIAGETGKTLEVKSDLKGKYIKVVATDAYGNSFSAATTAIPLPVAHNIVITDTGGTYYAGEDNRIPVCIYDAYNEPIKGTDVSGVDKLGIIIRDPKEAEIIMIDEDFFIFVSKDVSTPGKMSFVIQLTNGINGMLVIDGEDTIELKAKPAVPE